MVRDYGTNTLPTADGKYYPARRTPKMQDSTWYHILRTAQALYAGCMYDVDKDSAGWAAISGNIAVTFWPRNSVMNERYGIYAGSATDSSSSTFVSTN